MDFDTILEDIGGFGTYQKLIIYVVLLPAVFPCGFHAYSQIFMSVKPEHWCKVPQLDNKNLSVEAKKNLSIPVVHISGLTKFKECVYYDGNYSHSWMLGSDQELPCQDGWEYDTSVYTSTIVTEWDLVCDDDFYPTLALVLFGVGGCIGNYVFGHIQDSLGRKLAFFIYLTIESFFGVASIYATHYWTWTVLRFGVGFTVPAILESPYVLAVELIGPKDRSYCTIIVNIAYTIALITLSGVCYLFRDWRQLTLATTLPFLLLFLYWWVLPESPRWLFAKGKIDDCTKILKTIASVNKSQIPSDYFDSLKKNQQYLKEQPSTEREYGVSDLFRFPNLRKMTILITIIWITNTAVYVGLSYYAPALGNDDFLNFCLAALVELPAYIILWPAMEKLGRRWSLCGSMVIGGSACLATFLTQYQENVTLALYCLGKIGISCSFVVLPLMASELYPTVIRGIGLSFSSAVAQIGPIVIPLVIYLGEKWMVLPLLIMGALLLFGGVLGLILPETLHKHLPETLEEAEEFKKKSRKCSARNSIQEDNNSSTKQKNFVRGFNIKQVEVKSKEVQTVL